jgi:hypothetical protein
MCLAKKCLPTTGITARHTDAAGGMGGDGYRSKPMKTKKTFSTGLLPFITYRLKPIHQKVGLASVG